MIHMRRIIPGNIKIDDELHLDLLQESDAEEIFSLASKNKAYLSKFVSWINRINSIDDEITFIKSCKDRYFLGQEAHYSLKISADNTIIGSLSFIQINLETKEATIGYWLAENYQGRGYISKALKALIETTINTTDISSFIIKTEETNSRSNRIAIQNNFRLVGRQPKAISINGHERDLVIYQRVK